MSKRFEYKILLVLLLAFFAGISNILASNENSQSLDWNHELGPKIRFYILLTPGFGHQSNAINAAIYLRQQNYNGIIEIVDRTDLDASPVHQLLNQHDFQYYKLNYRTYENLKKYPDYVQYSFLGGYESDRIFFETYSHKLVILQPFAWREPPMIVSSLTTRIYAPNVFKKYHYSRQYDLRYNVIPNFKVMLEELALDPSVSPSLVSFFAGRNRSKHTDIALLYGMETIGDQSSEVNTFKLERVLELQLKLHKKRKQKNALVLFLFNEFTEKEIKSVIKKLNLKFSNLELIEQDDLLNVEQSSNKVFLVPMQSQPMKLFHFVLQESTYPVSLMGANLLASAIMHKKVFIPVDLIAFRRIKTSYTKFFKNFVVLQKYFQQYKERSSNYRLDPVLEKTALGSDVIDFYSDWMDSSASNYETKSLIWPDLNSNKLVDLIQLTKDNLPQQKSLLCSLLFI